MNLAQGTAELCKRIKQGLRRIGGCGLGGGKMPIDVSLELTRRRHCRNIEQTHHPRVRIGGPQDVVEKKLVRLW